MVQKRQLAEEEYDVSPKHLKMENNCQLVSCLEFPSKDVPRKPCNSAEGRFCKQTFESDCQFESGKITDLPVCIEKDVGSWTSSTTSEDVTPEHSPLKPRTEDTYSYLLRSPPLKEVPIGPEYQAEIPKWCGYDTQNASKTSSFCQNSVCDENKFMGSCVIPMPESDPTICKNDGVGIGRSDCFCEDRGSLRCVRQHISEARENVRGNIGHERFLELGFCNMGDFVACIWSEEDEQLFHEVVYSNPVSFGKNFWDHLAETFPSRTNQEIVSYYFNVFVLQKRAEQNRCDPMNADSDDDEWQGSDPSDEDDDLCFKNPILDYNDDIIKTRVDESGGVCDFQDDSCTSSDLEPQSNEIKVDCSKPWSNHEFIFEHSDSKAWDLGCFSFPRNKTDFLPTGSMIEEIFGVESWNIKVKDNNKD